MLVVYFEYIIIFLSLRDRVFDLVFLEYDEVVSFSLVRNFMVLYLYVIFDFFWKFVEFIWLYFKVMLYYKEVIYLY